MEKIWTKNLKTILGLFFAMNLCGIGVSLFIQANLGSDTITVLEEGISIAFDISIGNAANLYNIVLLLLAFILSRKDIGWTTFIYGLFVGTFIDFYNNLLIPLNIQQMHIAIRLLLIILGQICIILTFALLIIYRKGMNQLDAICMGLENMIQVSYKKIRTICDILFIVVGYFLGGTIGIGSLLSMFTTGYGIDLCLKIMNHSKE